MDFLAEEKIAPGSRILDLGCGPGIVAAELSKAGYRVSCMDFSSRLLLRARDMLKEETRFSPSFVQADGHSLPYRSGSFDGIVCIGVTSWVSDPVVVMREIARVLRPGGTLVITAVNMYSIENLFDPLFWWRRFTPAPLRKAVRSVRERLVDEHESETEPRLRQFALRSFDRMIENAGFSIASWRTIKYGHFRFFGRRIFTTDTEITIDRTLEKASGIPVIRRSGWLYIAKAKRREG